MLPKCKNLILISALVHTRVWSSWNLWHCGVNWNADDFCLFLLNLHDPISFWISYVILLNNASIYKIEVVEHTFNLLQADGFKVLFLLPSSLYFPFLNTTEDAFLKIKGAVLDEGSNSHTKGVAITIVNVSHWFTYMTCYYQQYAISLLFTGKPLDPTLIE